MLTAGTKLGPYEILGSLGAGGMGEVYRARDTRLKRDVAIKILSTHLSADPQFKARLQREAQVISSLQHPNICVLYDVGHEATSGIDYLVLEYLEGETLAQRLARSALRMADVLRIGAEIAAGLERAHAAGIVHRDFKPGNVMLTANGAKLLDFGLAKPTAAAIAAAAADRSTASVEPNALSREGTLVGTVDYLSPEQVEGSLPDERSDVFALGVVLYEMVTRRRAFTGPSVASTLAAILRSDPEPPSVVQPECPAALERIIQACLAKDPKQRWQSAADLRLQLSWLATDLQQSTRRAPTQKWLSGWRLAAASIVVAAAAVAIALVARPEAGRSVPPLRAQLSVSQSAGIVIAGTRAGPVAIAPDGTQVVYTGLPAAGSAPILWLHDLGTGQAQPLKGTENATFPFWSADGQSLGFFVDRRYEQGRAIPGSLKLYDVKDRSLRVVAEAEGFAEVRGASMNRRGDILFAPSSATPLALLTRDGAARRGVTTLQASRQELTHRWPQFLPDGERFLFFVESRQPEHRGTYLGSLQNAEPRLVLANTTPAVFVEPGWLLWVKQGQLLGQRFDVEGARLRGTATLLAEGVHENMEVQRAAFAAAPGLLVYHRVAAPTGQQAQLVDRNGQRLAALGEPGFYSWLRLSPDGRRFAFQIDGAVRQVALWTHDLERGTRTRVTPLPGSALAPAWSPDGSQLVFASSYVGMSDRAAGVADLFVQSASGFGKPAVLLADEFDKRPLSWSRDGRYLVYIARKPPDLNWDVRALLLHERRSITVVEGPERQIQPQLSRDGRWLAYVEMSADSVGPEVFVIPFPGGGHRYHVSRSGGDSPRWSDDGSEIFFVGGDGFLQTVTVHQTGNTLQLSTPQRLFPMPVSQFRGFTYDVLPDSHRFVVLTPELSGARDPLQLMVNWDRNLPQ